MPEILTLDEALCLELDEIARRRTQAGMPPTPSDDPLEAGYVARATRLKLTALCLSGGGIRSAAFCLGVLQSLAKRRLLNKFDYLSTVSGGGYIGGWLQVMLQDRDRFAHMNVDRSLEEFAAGTLSALRRLRGFTNFLTPQTGPFSADTWAGIMLYLRNLILTWIVILPFLMPTALAPVFYRTALFASSGALCVAIALLLLAAATLTYAAWQGCVLLPSHRLALPPLPASLADSVAIAKRIVAPAVAWAFLVPFAIDYALARTSYILARERAQHHFPDVVETARQQLPWFHCHAPLIPALYLVAMLAGYAIAWACDRRPDSRSVYRGNVLPWTMATVAIAALTWGGLALIEPFAWLNDLARALQVTTKGPLLVDTETTLTCMGPLLLIIMLVLHTTFYVALRRSARSPELDREWLARFSGLMVLVGLGWMALSACCLMLPPLLPILGTPIDDNYKPFLTSLAKLVGGSTVLGAIGAWLAKRAAAQINAVADQGIGRLGKWFSGRTGTVLLNAVAVLFGIALLIAAGSAAQGLLAWPQRVLEQRGVIGLRNAWAPLLLQVVLAMVLGWLAWRLGRINMNRFSMHAVYRNRLTRGFLGTARAPRQRHPDPFTGFDLSTEGPSDNPRLAELRDAPRGQLLFPVINVTLNVTAGSNTAWEERKGENFVATPLICGAAELPHPRQRESGDIGRAQGAFAHTCDYAGAESTAEYAESIVNPPAISGARLGSAMTLSGAAISPNWGYHSSRPTALLMSMFDVRLGAWLPNPSHRQSRKSLQLAGPCHSLRPLIGDFLGMTSDNKQAIYLSDGGHFENLAVYEMLRRRCRLVLVVDAGQDADCAFFDLGNAIRKAEVDLAVRVTMRPMHIYSRTAIDKDKPVDATGFAYGEIAYPEGGTGRLIYLKPTLLTTSPAAVLAFARDNASFPHVSTLDQWFTEDEFESYRALGAWEMAQVIEKMQGDDLSDLFDAADLACPK